MSRDQGWGRIQQSNSFGKDKIGDCAKENFISLVTNSVNNNFSPNHPNNFILSKFIMGTSPVGGEEFWNMTSNQILELYNYYETNYPTLVKDVWLKSRPKLSQSCLEMFENGDKELNGYKISDYINMPHKHAIKAAVVVYLLQFQECPMCKKLKEISCLDREDNKVHVNFYTEKDGNLLKNTVVEHYHSEEMEGLNSDNDYISQRGPVRSLSCVKHNNEERNLREAAYNKDKSLNTWLKRKTEKYDELQHIDKNHIGFCVNAFKNLSESFRGGVETPMDFDDEGHDSYSNYTDYMKTGFGMRRTILVKRLQSFEKRLKNQIRSQIKSGATIGEIEAPVKHMIGKFEGLENKATRQGKEVVAIWNRRRAQIADDLLYRYRNRFRK